MYFDSLHALWYMDGHGAYVWAAYGITLLVLLALLMLPRRRQRRLLEDVAGELRRAQGAPTQSQPSSQEDGHASGS